MRFDMSRVDHLRIDRSSVASQFPEQVFPDAAPCPAHKAIINRRRWAVSFRTIAPAAATLENVNDAADDPTIVGPLHSAHIRRQMRLNTFPLLIAQPEQISAHQSSPNTNQYRIVSAERLMSFDPSTRFPKFVIRLRILANELRKAKGTSKLMILVPLFDLTFLTDFAARDAGTSNRRH